MDKSFDAPLLPHEQPRFRSRPLVIATVLGAIGCIVCVGYFSDAFGKTKKVRIAGLTSLAAFPNGNATQCWQMTGGTCRILGCSSSRGPVSCYSGTFGEGYSCVCDDGYCAGSDGKCHKTTNKMVASHFTIKTTFRKEVYYLRATPSTDLSTGDIDATTDKKVKYFWSLWQLPDPEPSYLLVPEARPNSVIAEGPSQISDQHGPDVIRSRGPWHTSALNKGPLTAALTLVKIEDGYKISMNGVGGDWYLYIPKGNWGSTASVELSKGWFGGSSSTWQFDPELPDAISR